MSLWDKFSDFFRAHDQISNSKFLLAVSGGVDSMVLLHLFSKSDFQFEVAHMNYGLRGADSDADQDLVEKWCRDRSLVCHTTKTVITKGRNVQLEARQLRYGWFRSLLTERDLDFIATAHHGDDLVETFFINLIRGSGLKGLKSIPEITSEVIRPLLSASREEIEAYAVENETPWREDASNQTDKYLRNQIRHNILPVLSGLKDQALDQVKASIGHLADADALIVSLAEGKIDSWKISGDLIFIPEQEFHELIETPALAQYVFAEWELSFKSVEAARDLASSQPGRYIEEGDVKIYRDRSQYVVETKPFDENQEYNFELPSVEQNAVPHLKWSRAEQGEMPSGTGSILLDAYQFDGPLELRPWKSGDAIFPKGMKGRKKVSDLLTDLKLSVPEKKRVWVLIYKDDVVWVCGYRMSKAFIPGDDATRLYKLEWHG